MESLQEYHLEAFCFVKYQALAMTRKQEEQYKDTEQLREILTYLKGMKFKLDCGHHVTFGHHLSNDITIRNSSLRVVCSLCGYEGE